MIKRLVHFVFCILISAYGYTQNLSGVWGGSIRSASYIKLELVHTADSCFGYRLSNKSKHTDRVNLQGYFNNSENILTGKAINLTDDFPENDFYIFKLTYSTANGHEYLSGLIAPEYTDEMIMTVKGLPLILEKLKDTVFHRPKKQPKQKEVKPAAPPKQQKDTIKTVEKKSLDFPEEALDKNREVKIVKIITVKVDTVKIMLKDDGELDGDIVTVLDNGKAIIKHLLLGAEPYEITLHLPPDNSMHILELVAENEGTVPPNTAYMLVLAGDKRVEVKTSSNKLTNAAIVIQMEE